MNRHELRTTVLLGAGASVDAGVPVSVELTQIIAERVSTSAHSGASSALNVAIGAMIAHDTARGGGPYDGVDVERLFSAVEMLADRENLEIAPFVAAWNPALDGIGNTSGGLSPFWGKNFKRAGWLRQRHR